MTRAVKGILTPTSYTFSLYGLNGIVLILRRQLNMYMKIFVALIILIAVVVGVLALALPRDQLIRLIVFRDFFDVTLPILAFGALVKYLCTCCMKCDVCHHDEKKSI